MQIVYRVGDAEHVYEADHAEGMIMGIIAKSLPREVAAIAHNGTPRRPERTTRDELASAISAVLDRFTGDPGLLFSYAFSVADLGLGPPVGRAFTRGGAVSGIRFPDTPADRAYALCCGPGQCDLEEMAIGPDGRGTVVSVADMRGEGELQTANMGRIQIHRRRVKTQIVQELGRLLAAVQEWPAGEVCKFAKRRD